MSLSTKFRQAAIEQSLARNTVENYGHWHRMFYRFCRVPASQWTGEMVRRWMVHLFDSHYGPVSRKQALCAIKFVFDHTTAIYLHADAAKGFSPLDVPPERALLR